MSKKLNCRVLNFGVQGYGTDQSFIRYMNNNKKANIVAINHFSENVVRNINQFRNLLYPTDDIMLKPRFILNDKKIKLVKTPKIYNLNKKKIFKELKNEYFLPGKETGIIENINYSYIYNLYKILTNHHKFKAFFRNEPHSKQFYNKDHQSKALEITYQILYNFHNFAINKNQIPIITIIPHCKDFNYYKKNNKIPYQNLIDKLNFQNIFFIDFLPKIFEKYPNYKNLYMQNCKGQHFNKAGNKFLSEIFHEFLKENKIFK